MTILLLGLVVFLGVHTFATMRGQRMAVIARIGEGPYKGAFSLIALAGLVLIVWGFGLYRASGYIQIWFPPVWTRHLAMPLMWVAFVCLAAAYTPTGKIRTTLRHPMLVAIKTWALSHLLANGDLGSMILFGAFLAWAVYDRISVKRRGESPAAKSAFNTGDALAVAVGTAAYIAMLWAHPFVIGAPVM